MWHTPGSDRPEYPKLMNVYPIFLNDLDRRQCVVIGGDEEAHRKIGSLLNCAANVTVICPDVDDAIVDRERDGQITLLNRPYRSGDLTGVFLAIITNPGSVDADAIQTEAEQKNVLINMMDDIPRSSFVAGSVVRRGQLVVSISTSGAAPTIAVRLRHLLEQTLGSEYEMALSVLGDLRGTMLERFPGFEDRRNRWYSIVDSDLIELLASKRIEEANALLRQFIGDNLPVQFQHGEAVSA